jgi:uncharacterized protein YegL
MGLRDLGIEIKISKRPLDIIYMLDTSGSMQGAKIQAVNNAMHELEHLLRDEAAKNPTAQVNVRIITFGGQTSNWHLRDRTNVESFRYTDINDVDGMTPLGHALGLLSDSFSGDNMPKRGLKPIVVLMSDGQPNDDWAPSLDRFLALPWGKKAIKVAIAIGKDANRDVLARFTTNPELVLNANNSTDLKSFISWTSTLITHTTQHDSQVRDNAGKIRLNIKPPAPRTMLTDDNKEFV